MMNEHISGKLKRMAESWLERTQPASPILVLAAEGPLVVPVGSLDDPLERKRRAVWQNQARNQVVGRIAEAFADRNIRALWDHGLLLDQAELQCPAPWPRSTTIMVESAEHGNALAQCQPGWKLLHAVHGKPGSVYDKPPTRVHRIDRAIVTLVAANELDVFCPDLLIVAMGGDWAFELPNFKPASDQPMVLVDVLDDFDDVAKRGSVARLRAYAARGWKIVTGSKWKQCGLASRRTPEAQREAKFVHLSKMSPRCRRVWL